MAPSHRTVLPERFRRHYAATSPAQETRMASAQSRVQREGSTRDRFVRAILLVTVAICGSAAQADGALYELDRADPIRVATRSLGFLSLKYKEGQGVQKINGQWDSMPDDCPAAVISARY